jgi:hypothetical protein
MKKTFQPLLFVMALTLGIAHSQAQSMGESYKTALGVKFYPGAISLKHFIRNDRALEGLGYFWDHGFRFTGLYEIHGDIGDAPGLKWYVGPGAHIGVYNGGWYYKDHFYDNGALSLGIDGVLGLDYKINQAPINLSLDFQPSFELITHPYFSGWGGLAIRYTF